MAPKGKRTRKVSLPQTGGGRERERERERGRRDEEEEEENAFASPFLFKKRPIVISLSASFFLIPFRKQSFFFSPSESFFVFHFRIKSTNPKLPPEIVALHSS